MLFLLATLLSGRAVLPQAHATDIYLTAVGLLTAVYIAGLLFRSRRRIAGMGVDSLAVLVLYVISLFGLFAIAGRPGEPSLAMAGALAYDGPFWASASRAMPVAVAGAAIGLINALGNLGGPTRRAEPSPLTAVRSDSDARGTS